MSFLNYYKKFVNIFSGKGLREKFPIINHLFTWINKSITPKSVKIFDHEMFLDDQDSMELAINGVYEPIETNLIEEIINPGDVVIDVGANIGYFTLLFAKLVGDTGKVFAFEPDQKLYDLLEKNIARNEYQNVISINKGLSDKNTSSHLYLDKYKNLDNRIYPSDNSSGKVEINLVRFDDFIQEYSTKVDLIKIDIQGAEGLALSGMSKTIDANPTIKIISEFWPWSLKKAGTKPDEFLKSLQKYGFLLFDIDHSLEEPISIEWLLEKYPATIDVWTNLYCTRLIKS